MPPRAIANDLSAFGRHAPPGLARRPRAHGAAVRPRIGRGSAWPSPCAPLASGRSAVGHSTSSRSAPACGSTRGTTWPRRNLLFTPQYFDPKERRFLAERLGSDFVFIDIGANVGGYALFVATLAGPRARVLAIEPQADIFERLTFNIRQNSFPAIKALELAVTDRDGDVTLFVDAKNKGETSMRLVGTQGPAASVRVPGKALASIVAEERVRARRRHGSSTWRAPRT